MSQRSKKELTEAIRNRYLKANKAEKGRILDEFVAATGYLRKYAICLLKHSPKSKGLKKKGRRRSWKLHGIRGMHAIYRARPQLRRMAFQIKPRKVTENCPLRKHSLSVEYAEKIQNPMPIFSGPHQSRH